MPRRVPHLVLPAVVALVLTGCGGEAGTAPPDAVDTTATADPSADPTAPTRPTAEATPPADDAAGERIGDLVVEEIATDLEVPWGVAFTPDDRVFVTLRDVGGVVEVLDNGSTQEVLSFEVDATGEGGLLGIAPSPDYAEDGWLYVYYTGQQDNRVVRARLNGEREPVVTGIPKASVHDGGRLAFGPDGKLYIGTGDASVGGRAQDLDSLAGKILRVEPDGSIPQDNPFPDSPVWTLGHRNVQGLGWTRDGAMYATEYGPDRDDEINRIEPGNNYGWPLVTGDTTDDRFTDPVLVRQPPDASWSGMAVPTGSQVPAWDGDLVAASLRGQRLWRVQLDDDGTVQQATDLLVGRFGRLRLATQAPDGSIWVLTSNRDGRGDPGPGDDKILRLTAAPG